MSREEIQKLLGGYATDTLSEAERRALFEAALEDQDLFDALAKEQALRDVLRDPAARQQLMASLGPAREPLAARGWRWLHWLRQPGALAMVGGMAGLLMIAGLVLHEMRRPALRVAMVAESRIPPPAPPLSAPLPEMAPSAVRRKMFRPPAAQKTEPSTEPSAALPAPPALPAAQPAAPALVSSLASANGAPAATPEVKRETLPAAQDSMMRFNSVDGQRLGTLARAKAAAAAPAKLAVEYTLLLRNADGAFAPAPLGTVFHAGDWVRLQVVPREAGYIYLFQRGAAGWGLVASQRVEKGQRYELPATGGLQSEIPARLELRVVLSRVAQPPPAAEVDALAASKITLEYR